MLPIALEESLPAPLAATAPAFGGGTEGKGVRPVRLVPEDPVGAGLDRRLGPGSDEGTELRTVGASRPNGAAVVEDLTDP